MERRYEVGAHIIFIDEFRKQHNALVLIWWMPGPDSPYGEKAAAVNIVLVDSDPQKEDSYGRQIRRETSVVHLSQNAAKGNCWCWPDEAP